MTRRDYIDFQTRTQPLAYLITFRCYGTWLHGEKRGSVDRRHYHRFGTPGMPANQKIFKEEQNAVGTKRIRLNKRQRAVVEFAIEEVCTHRKYGLYVVNARTNHVHTVVAASVSPEHVMESFKSYATRKLRRTNLLGNDVKPWARHGSTRYLWTEEDVAKAIEYVMFGQGGEPFC